MINSGKHILLFVLVIVAGGAISQQNVVVSNISQSEHTTPCQQLSNSTAINLTNLDPVLANSSKSETTNAQPVTVTSCNSLLNILPAENHFSFSPLEEETSIGFSNVIISSQTFVFQEPDPPRFG